MITATRWDPNREMTTSAIPKWSKAFETGVKAIDNDHKALFDEIKQLAMVLLENGDRDAIDRAISCLENYVHEHFNREETFMINAGYPGTEAHIKSHRALTRQVALLKKINRSGDAEIDPVKLVRFLSDWLSHHIVNIDMAYVPYLQGDADDREDDLSERLHEVNVHVPQNKRKVVEDFVHIILSDHAAASELSLLIGEFESRLEKDELTQVRAAFCKT